MEGEGGLCARFFSSVTDDVICGRISTFEESVLDTPLLVRTLENLENGTSASDEAIPLAAKGVWTEFPFGFGKDGVDDWGK